MVVKFICSACGKEMNKGQAARYAKRDNDMGYPYGFRCNGEDAEVIVIDSQSHGNQHVKSGGTE